MQQIGLQAVFDDANFQQGLQRYVAGVNKAEKETTQSATAITQGASRFRQFGETVDRSGRQAMIGMRSIGELADLSGLDKNLSQTVYQAASATDAVGDLSGAFAMLNPVLLAVVGLGAGVALVFGKMQEEARKTAEEVAKISAPFDEAKQKIAALIELKGIDQVAKEMGVSTAALEKYAATNVQANRLTQDYTELLKQRALKEAELARTEAELADFQSKTNELLAQGAAPFLITRQIDEYQAKLRSLKTDIQNFNTVIGVQTPLFQGAVTTNANQTLVAEFERQRWQAVQNASQEIARIESNLADQRASIWASAASSISNIQSGLTRTLAGLDRDYARQMEKLAQDEVSIAADAAKAIAEAYRDAGKEAAEVERDRQNSLAQVNRDSSRSMTRVDEDLAMSLRNARSARERRTLRLEAALQKKRIAEDAADRKADIDRQAAERQAQIIQRRNERIAEANEQKAERLQQLAERRQEAARELQQRKNDAREAAAEQIRQARIAAAEQVRAAQDRANREKAIVHNELVTIVNDVNSRIKALGGSVAADGASLGTQLITSMAQAIRNGQSVITDALKSVVSKATQDAGRIIQPPPGTEPQMYHAGGWTPNGLIRTQVGEYVLSRQQARAFAPILAGATYNRTLNFNHTWNGAASSFDRHEVERIAERAAYHGVEQAMGRG